MTRDGDADMELKDALGPPRIALVLGAEGPGHFQLGVGSAGDDEVRAQLTVVHRALQGDVVDRPERLGQPLTRQNRFMTVNLQLTHYGAAHIASGTSH